MEALRHIRTTDANVKDQRFRFKAAYANKARPTFCGAEPTRDDRSRKDARHLIKHEGLLPHWTADLCPACREALLK
jgi:hypothetical protein